MSKEFSDKGINTQAIHAGEGKRAGSSSSAPDLVMSSTFLVDQELSFSANRIGADAPYVYTRWANPTTAGAMPRSRSTVRRRDSVPRRCVRPDCSSRVKETAPTHDDHQDRIRGAIR